MRSNLKRAIPVVIATLFLAGCSSSNEASKKTTYYVPGYCSETKVLKALPSSIPNAEVINTDWQPAEGTDLFAALNAGGLACSFGNQSAEIGATVLWAPDDDALFADRVKSWSKEGQTQVDLPGFDGSSAYQRLDNGSVRTVNVLINGFWIQVSATFTTKLDEMVPLVKAALESLRDDKSMAKENVTGCFAATVGNDLLVLKLQQEDRNLVYATVGFYWNAKDSNEGTMIASYRNGILTGIYDATTSKGASFKSELFFKGDKSGFVKGTGPTEMVNKVEQLMRPLNLKWDETYKYVPSDKCS